MSEPDFWTSDRRKARRTLQRRLRELNRILATASSAAKLDSRRFTYDLELRGESSFPFEVRKRLTLEYFLLLENILDNPDMSSVLANALDCEIRRLTDPTQAPPPPSKPTRMTQLARVNAYQRRQEQRSRIESELRSSSDQTVNFGYATMLEPSLRSPWVHYPGQYGIFSAFSPTASSKPTFCSCQKRAILNYLTVGRIDIEQNFPRTFHSHLSHAKTLPSSIVFDEGLCHRCNGSWPTLRFTFDEDLSSFHQACIPYILQEWLRCGIYVPSYPWRDAAGSVPCPEEEEIQRMHLEADELYKKLYPTPPRDPAVAELDPEFVENKVRYNALRRVVGNIIEDRVRADFGYPLIGSRLQSETVLFELVSQILPQETIHRHVRSIPALKGLEIDIWIPRLQLGIEYQGKQHYEPVAHWGGAEGLRLVQERDHLKKQRCSEIGIQLVEIKYTESLTLDHVRRRLSTFV